MKWSKIIGAAAISAILSISALTIYLKKERSNSQNYYHTANWYLSHPEILQIDEKKCTQNAADMNPALCQNVASASSMSFAKEMRKAAIANDNKN